jgi:hypothetical protein
MTRWTLAIVVLAGYGLAAARIAAAGVPDPTNFECRNVGALNLGINCPKSIYVVGDDATGVVDPVGEFCVFARDFNNQPIPNSMIVIDFSNCDVQLCADQRDPAVIVDCVSRTVRKLTDAAGVACFRVRGKTRLTGDVCAFSKGCVEVFADGVFVCGLDAPTFDLVNQGGEDGLNPNDLSNWINLAFNCAEGPYRGNYDCTNQSILDPNDLSVWLRVNFAARSVSNCGAAGSKCP